MEDIFLKQLLNLQKKVNEKNPILLTGAFLPNVDYANLLSYWGGGSAGPLFIPVVEGEDSEPVQENIKRFESYCQKNGIEYRVHKDFEDFALPELKKETRFADVLIISGNTFYKNPNSDEPSEYLKEALHGVECSVVVVPEESTFPESNILAYDGNRSICICHKTICLYFS
jgi:hypothetical protein